MKLEDLKKITPYQELIVINRSRELKKVIADMAERITVPALRETDGNNEAKAVLHYFDTYGSADWFIFEANLETGEGYGFVTYSGFIEDPDAEFGYVDLFDLAKSARINLDLHYHEGITKKEIFEKRRGAEQEETRSEYEGITASVS